MRVDHRVVACALLLTTTAFAQPNDADHAGADHAGHAHAHEGQQRRIPQNSAREDASLPAGTIVATIVDPNDKPLAGIPVTLGIVENSVAKGESRKRELAMSGADGTVRWDNLSSGSGFAYRISVQKDGATFAVTPFQLSPSHGQRALAHVYPVVRSIDAEGVMILSRGDLILEIKDDRVQVQQELTIANFGQAAWVPEGVTFDVPHEMTAFTFDQGMSDVGIDKVADKDQLRLRGTFAPGQHRVAYRWQLPYAGERTLSFALDTPPNMAQGAVVALAAQGMKMDVKGMGEAKLREDLIPGQRVIGVEWDSLQANGALRRYEVTLRDIPEAGLPIWAVRLGVGLAAFAALATLLTLRKREAPATTKGARDILLEELTELERSRERGDIGPKTYERARRELIDQLALTFAEA